jgi:hypothetical protein
MFPNSNYVPPIHGGNQLVQEKLAYDQHSLTTDADDVEDSSMMISTTHMKLF